MVKPLCRPKKLISKHILQKSRPSIRRGPRLDPGHVARSIGAWLVVSGRSRRLMCSCVAERRYVVTNEKHKSQDSETSHKANHVLTREVVQLSKLPDAQQPDNGEVPAIERADWPAPPHPAAAYPELCMYSVISQTCIEASALCRIDV